MSWIELTRGLGIHYSNNERKFKVYIDMPGYQRLYVGTFITYEEASEALYETLKENGIEDHPHTRNRS